MIANMENPENCREQEESRERENPVKLRTGMMQGTRERENPKNTAGRVKGTHRTIENSKNQGK